MKKFMVKCYNKSGINVETYFCDSISQAETIRSEWASANEIKEFSYMPTIWKNDWKKRSYIRVMGY